MFLLEITLGFDKALRDLTQEHCKEDWKEIYQFCKGHQNKPLVLRNLSQQIYEAERSVKVKLDKARRDKLIEVAAALFIDQTIKQRHQALASSAERQRIRDESRSPEEKAKEILGDTIEEIDTTKGLN